MARRGGDSDTARLQWDLEPRLVPHPHPARPARQHARATRKLTPNIAADDGLDPTHLDPTHLDPLSQDPCPSNLMRVFKRWAPTS